MTATGTFRVHFNRHGAAPLVWCVSTDAWELAVSEVRFDDCQIKSVYRPKETADDDDGKPSAWFEVVGFEDAGEWFPPYDEYETRANGKVYIIDAELGAWDPKFVDSLIQLELEAAFESGPYRGRKR